MVQLALPKNTRLPAYGPAHASQELEGPAGQGLAETSRRDPPQGVPRLSLGSRRRRQPAHRHLLRRSRYVPAHGPGRADLDQVAHRCDPHVPPVLPRGHLRLLRDEHRGREHAGLHQGHGRGEGADQALPPAAHGGHQGPGARPHALLRPARPDRALAPHLEPGAREGVEAVAEGAARA